MSARRLIRVLFVLYCFGAFAVALWFSGVSRLSTGTALLLVVAVVFYIIAGAALQIAHQTEGRPLTDLLLVFLYPFAAYSSVFFAFDFTSRPFWVLAGYSYFIIITGGFIFGIFLSPLLARRRGFSKREVGNIVNYGIRFIEERKLGIFALVMFGGLFAALAYFFNRMLSSLPGLSALGTIGLALLLLAATAAIAGFTYRHTVFNLRRDEKLRKKYRPPS